MRSGWILGLVLAGATVLLCLGATSVPLLDPDEARFARTSVEMLRSGDFVVPHFESAPRVVKPPMLHWLQAALFSVFGAGEWVARAHSIAATLGSILLVTWIARKRFGPEAAVWGATVLGTMPLVVVLGRLGTLDALLSVHVLAAVALDIAEPDEPRPFGGFAVGLLTGIAFLIKGPVGVILPLLAMLVGRTACGRDLLPSIRGALEAVAGWCVVVLPWGLVFLRRMGATATDTLHREVLERYVDGVDHIEPAWYFLAVAAVGFSPWIVLLVSGLVRAALHRRAAIARSAVYSGAALVAGLIFFSLGKSKLASYILPLAPFAAIVVTWQIGQELRSGHRRPGGIGGTSVLTLLVALGLAFAGWKMDPGVYRTVAFVGAWIHGIGGGVGLVAYALGRPRAALVSSVLSAAFFLFVAAAVLPPEIANRRSAAALVASVPELRSSRPLVRVDMKLPSLTFYLDRTPEEVDMVDLPRRLARDDDPLLVLDLDDLSSVTPEVRDGLREVGKHGKYVVLEKSGSLDAIGAER